MRPIGGPGRRRLDSTKGVRNVKKVIVLLVLVVIGVIVAKQLSGES